ncbi:hypothetical protein N9112_03855, partial [bacterium]|nr:hypothetical protein [bacterium]
MNHYTKNTLKIISSLCLFSVLISCSPANENTSEKPTSQTDATTEEAVNNEFPYTFEKVADNTWVMHGPREMPNPQNKGFMNNPGIVKTSAGLVMIDPGSTVQ